MAKKKKRGNRPDLPRISLAVRAETTRSIYAIGAGVFALVFILAPLKWAGPVGKASYDFLTYLFGVGYYLLPISLAFLAIGLIRERTPESVGTGRIIGATLLFVAGIGILALAAHVGGVAGDLVSYPFVSFFGMLLGAVMLTCIAIIGFLIALDTPLAFSLSSLPFLKKKSGDVSDDADEGVEEDESPEPEDAAPEEEAPPTRGIFSRPQAEPEPEPRGIAFAPIDQAYEPPPVSLLDRDKGKPGVGDIKANANIIKRTLANFGIEVEMDEVSIGPTVTRYALKPAEGVRLQKILGLQNNLELALAASPVRIEAPIPGKSLVGIEVPNQKKATVGLGSLLSDAAFTDDKRPLLVALGRDIAGAAHFANIAKMPHLLVAGATGSGKSVSIHAIIASLLYRNGPGTMRFIMVDPKRVELTLYNPIPHLLTPVITDPKKAILSLKWAAKEMERRYNLLESHAVRDIASYHENVVAKFAASSNPDSSIQPPDQMPYIVIIIDEVADIMQTYPRELEAAVVRLAQMSRAVGIHLILSTQRPSVNIITGTIKANIPARIALQVASQIDSRTILDAPGAENLLGAGDMLYQSADMPKPRRIQTAFISEQEVKEIASYIKKHNEPSVDDIAVTAAGNDASPNAIFSASFEGNDVDDDLFDDARQTVEEAGKASTSFLQRKLRIGYARAARLMDILEEKGIIGPGDGAKPREVLTAHGSDMNDATT